MKGFGGFTSTDSVSIHILLQITINQFLNKSYCHMKKRTHEQPHFNLPGTIQTKIAMDNSLYTIRPAIKDDCIEIRRLIQVNLNVNRNCT